jgi:hypothetical protein
MRIAVIGGGSDGRLGAAMLALLGGSLHCVEIMSSVQELVAWMPSLVLIEVLGIHHGGIFEGVRPGSLLTSSETVWPALWVCGSYIYFS